jgi:hypothetical protein
LTQTSSGDRILQDIHLGAGEAIMQRSRWAILWAVVLILGGGFLLAQNFDLIQGQFQASLWTIIVGGLGILFLLDAITTTGRDWWALIPGCILIGVAATIWLGEREVQGEWLGSLMLFSIGLPFLLIYLIKRGTFWWALIPGGVMVVVAVVPLLTLGVRGEIISAFVLWVIALPFLIVYLANRQQWWALIPAGTLFVIGLMPLLTLGGLREQFVGGLFFIGLAAVFGLLYLLNLGQSHMFWAVYPAAILFAIGLGVMAFGQNWWPLILIAVGLVLLLRGMLPRRR